MKQFKFFILFMGIMTLALVTSCNKDEHDSKITKQENVITQLNLDNECPQIQLYDFENIGQIHNHYLNDMLVNGKFDSNLDLTTQINNYTSTYGTPPIQELLNGDPWVSSLDIINRNQVSPELKSFALSIINYLYNTNEILMNQDYQTYIQLKVNQSNSLVNLEDRNKAKRMLALLSHSIDFWLPNKYCGKGGYALVFTTDLDSELELRRSWLTNFADIWSHDCVGALFGALVSANPVGAGVGFAANSAGRALGLAWDGGY